MLDPGGTLAVASRQDNIASTATVFCLLGCSWPQALSLAHTCFDAVDQDGLIDTTPSPLINGAGQLLQDLHQQGVTAAVISNDTHSGIKDFLAHHQLGAGVAGIWSADDHPRKPDPQAVLELCEGLGLPPQRCALVGDAETDLQMALEAGVHNGLAGHAAGGILGQQSVKNGVAHLVADLVGMPFGYGLRRKDVTAHSALQIGRLYELVLTER